MFNKQLKENIRTIDTMILVQNGILVTTEDEVEYNKAMQKIEELTKLRSQMTEDKVKDSSRDVIVSGIFGLVGVVMVIHHEQTNAVTSKAFGMIPKLFKGV